MLNVQCVTRSAREKATPSKIKFSCIKKSWTRGQSRNSRKYYATKIWSYTVCTMKNCRCWTAHVGERRAVAGAGTIGEQVASEQVTCRCYYSCCTVLLLFCSLLYTLQICYVWVLGRAYFRMGWAYFWERGFSKICPSLSLSSHLSSSPMGVFSRDCGKFFWQ